MEKGTLTCDYYVCDMYIIDACNRLEKDGKLERAVQCYREALADDPSQQTARTRLELITAALEKQVGINSVVLGPKCVLWILSLSCY